MNGPINFETCTKSHVTEINQTYVKLHFNSQAM